MMRKTGSRSYSMLVVFAVACLGCPLIAVAQDAARSEASDMMRLGLRGVFFVPNHGQWSDAEVRYGLRSHGLDVAFRESSYTMHLRREQGDRIGNLGETASASSGAVAEYEMVTLGVTFPGSNPVLPQGVQPQTARFNYFVGGEGRGIASEVPSFGAVLYKNLYDGVDLHVMGNDDGILKYEFRVAPGADYGQIRIAYDGIDSLCIDNSGDLRINTSFGTLADAAPVVWQEIAGERVAIRSRFNVIDDHTYRVELDDLPDASYPMIIDPDIEWMYYFGGGGADQPTGIALDSQGNVILTGATTSSHIAGELNSPHGGKDVFVAKIDTLGSTLWLLYLGGSLDDLAAGVAVDGADAMFLTGVTYSNDFAHSNNTFHGPGFQGTDAFVAKVTSDGVPEWATYLGGSRADSGAAISVDTSGSPIVVGSTSSTDFEGRNNANHTQWPASYDAFAARVDTDGSLTYMTYLGGSGDDFGAGIDIDGARSIYVAGTTDSGDFEGRIGPYRHYPTLDTFVLLLDPSGVVDRMMYAGGEGEDRARGICADGKGNAYVCGVTASLAFDQHINYSHGYYDALVMKVTPDLQLSWMTYLGGAFDEGYYGYTGIAVDQQGSAYVTSYTSSTDFEGHQNAPHGAWDAFAVKVNASGILQWMTYLGGTSADWGTAIATNALGTLYVVGVTDSVDFEGRRNSHHSQYVAWDGFLVSLSGLGEPPLLLAVAAACPSGGPIRIEWSGATPGGQAALIFARNTGSFTIPINYPCPGTQLGLGSDQIQLAWQGGAGADGSRVLNTNAGSGACGGHLQLLDISTCATSNVARLE